ncbi:hypothetical protein ACFL52_01610, partial [Candidatus Margulisiibacteriota bacterium]
MAKVNRKKSGKRQKDRTPSKHRHDIIGILLIAFGIFVLVSNHSDATGIIGYYAVKVGLRSFLGLGVYVLPFFISAYGLILILRHEVKELAVRLSGLSILFLSFITFSQFRSPVYFATVTEQVMLQG